MKHKSDIELILESQTWKKQGKKGQTSKPQPKHPRFLNPISAIDFRLNIDSPSEESPIIPTGQSSRKSLLAIPLGSLTSRISNFVIEDDLNKIKIPTFPRTPFGEHCSMLTRCPTFEVIHKEMINNADSIKAIKLESGRIKRCIHQSISAALIKNKNNRLHKKNSRQLTTS